MEKDIAYLDKIISLKSNLSLFNNYFCWLYPFTNENINGYYSKLDFKGKNVLTVISSGDHILNAILMGALSIDAFDSNRLAKYYSELKIAAIKQLSLEEFVLFFYNKSLFKMSPYYFDKKIYLKIREELDYSYRKFWDYVFEKYKPKKIYRSFLFTDDFLDLKGLIKANSYLNVDNYAILKEKLQSKKIRVNYHDKKLQDISNVNKKFDLIILSNVPAFLDEIYDSECLKNFKNLINDICNENTKIVICYMYSNLLERDSSEDCIYNERQLRKYFPYEDYEYIEFESSDTLDSESKLKKIFPKVDKVLVNRNKKNIKD